VFYETNDLTTECYCSDEQLEEQLSVDTDADDEYIDSIKNYACSCLFL
jgi:hypothetical protein